jgi:hypothetical protein
VPVLAISDPVRADGSLTPIDLCRTGLSGTRVICFQPHPTTTQGEARSLRDLAAKMGWKSVAVIVSTDQLRRARLLTRRCYGGRLAMVATPRPKLALMGSAPYEWAATVKAFFNRGC